MIVGDGGEPFQVGRDRGVVCGDMKYFERQPIGDLWVEINNEAVRFFADVDAGNTGDPFGVPVEKPLLDKLFRPRSASPSISRRARMPRSSPTRSS